jgi:hypothetical protein
LETLAVDEISENMQTIMENIQNPLDLHSFKTTYVLHAFSLHCRMKLVVDHYKNLVDEIRVNSLKFLYERENVSAILLDLYKKSEFNPELHKKLEYVLLTSDDIDHFSNMDGTDRVYFQKGQKDTFPEDE